MRFHPALFNQFLGAGGPPEFVADYALVADQTSYSATPEVMALPTNAVSGDLVLYIIQGEHGGWGAYSLSTGWTSVSYVANSSTWSFHQVVARVLDGTANDTLTITGQGTFGNKVIHTMRVPSAQHLVTDTSWQFGVANLTGTSTSINPPSALHSTGVSNQLVLAIAMHDSFSGSTLDTTPVDYTQLHLTNHAAGYGTGVAWAMNEGVGSDPGPFTSSTSRPYVATTITLPIVGGTTPEPGAIVHDSRTGVLVSGQAPVVPPDVQVGDLLLVTIGGGRQITNVAGHSLTTWWWLEGPWEGNTNSHGSVLVRIADGTAADTPPVITTAGQRHFYTSYLIRAANHAVVDPFDVQVDGYGANNSVVNPFPVVVSDGQARDGVAFVHAYCYYGTSLDAPPGYTAPWSAVIHGGSAGLGAYQEVTGAEIVDPGTMPSTHSSTGYWIATTVFIPTNTRPATPTLRMRHGLTKLGSPPIPRYTEVGDVLLFHQSKTQTSRPSTFIDASGFTVLSNTGHFYELGYKIADGTEGGTNVTLSGGGPVSYAAKVIVIRGLDTAALNSVYAEGGTVSDANPIPVPAITPTAANSAVFTFVTSGNNNAGTIPPSDEPDNPDPDWLISYLKSFSASGMVVWLAEVNSTAEVPSESVNPSGWANWKEAARWTAKLTD